MRKPLNTAQLMEKFLRLKKDDKIDILYGALRRMEQYNGQSKTTCIARATAEHLKLEHDDNQIT